MHPSVRNIGAFIAPVTNFVDIAKPAGTAVNGDAYQITGSEGLSLKAIIAAQANLDDADTLTVSAIKVESATESTFAAPTTVGTASNLVLTGGSGETDVDHFGQASINVDLTQLTDGHIYLRLTATPTLSDVPNTDGRIAGLFVFGGQATLPA